MGYYGELQSGELFDRGVNKIAIQMAETEDEFIFRTISPFADQVSEKHISKDELVEAVVFFRRYKEGLEKYGVDITKHMSESTSYYNELLKAYTLGVKHGADREKKLIKDFLNED